MADRAFDTHLSLQWQVIRKQGVIATVEWIIRALMCLASLLSVVEGFRATLTYQAQNMLAASIILVSVGTLGSQLLSSRALGIGRLMDRRERALVALSGLLVQSTLLMRTESPGGIYMTWITFATAILALVYWLAAHLGLIELAARAMSSGGRSLPGASQWRRPTSSAASVVGVVGLVFAGWVVLVLLPWDDVAKHDSRWNAIRRTLFADGADAAQRAEAYFQSQRPLIEQNLRAGANGGFTLHPYFAKSVMWPDARWDQIIHQRVRSMGAQLTKSGASGFKIEKDKCAMFKFFEQNGIPIPRVLKVYRSREELEARLSQIRREVQSDPNAYAFPMFLKGCHLTQGSDKGMVPLKRRDFTDTAAFNSLTAWVDRKWPQRPNDNGRGWSAVMNQLLGTLEPGMAIQGPFTGMRVSPYNTPLEVKVEVVWGRAYLGLFADYHDVIALRNGALEFSCRDRACPQWWTHGNVPDTRLAWVVENGHMDAVWQLAERVAKDIGIDEVRVDIFINPCEPSKPVVNEISLSSGHEYMYHTDFLAKSWAGPHLTRLGISQPLGDVWTAPTVRKLPSPDLEVHDQKMQADGSVVAAKAA